MICLTSTAPLLEAKQLNGIQLLPFDGEISPHLAHVMRYDPIVASVLARAGKHAFLSAWR